VTNLAPPPLTTLGVTYRQLDHWCRRGYLHPANGHPGSGNRRTWTDSELAVAHRMAQHVRNGMYPRAAAQLARQEEQ